MIKWKRNEIRRKDEWLESKEKSGERLSEVEGKIYLKESMEVKKNEREVEERKRIIWGDNEGDKRIDEIEEIEWNGLKKGIVFFKGWMVLWWKKV